MRFFMFALGRALSEKVKPIIGQAETINCPSLQRLLSATIRKDDIIITREAAFGSEAESCLKAIGTNVIVFISAESKKRKNNCFTYLNIDCSDSELRNALTTDNTYTMLCRYLAGSSEIMRRTRYQLLKATKSSLPIHLVGETGTGKTLAAKLIHSSLPQKKHLVVESCGCLSKDIAESELFGHIKGAFSGAIDNREGLLAQADGSTLFLDEIQDLDIPLQLKLLRVLDSGEYRKLGSDKTLRTSFRLITASNLTLSRLLAEKRIRKDFYYRISGIEIRMPSLDEHMEDIPEILDTFAKLKGVSSDKAMDYSRFMHSFPGNVRELYKEAELYLQGFLL